MINIHGGHYIVTAKDRITVALSRNTHSAIVAYAKANGMTMTEALQYLLIKALKDEYK